MSVLYPVAASVEEALARPRARAAREREASAAAAGPVRFTTELAGPAFATREAALDAYAGRIDDEGRRASAAPEDRWCALVEVAAGPPPAPLKPVMEDGRRWPVPPSAPATAWRLSVSYWRLGEAAPEPPRDQARALRRQVEGAALPGQALRALAHQPLQPVRPQQPLDIGLFEVRLPEAPDTLMADE